MAANFEVKFIVDRVSGNYKIQITDTSTDFTLVKANTKITFPDGYVLENTDLSNPDISSAGGNVQKNLRLDVNNKPVTGDYTIKFTGYDASDNEYSSQKQFNFTFSEPSILIQDLSDSGIPVVKFKDITSWTQANFTASATTREFNVDYPSTSAVDGQSKTESNTNLSTPLEIDMVNSLNYYEGVYDVTLALDITYTHTNGYLSVQYKKNSTQDFPIKRTPSQSDLLDKINQYKENIDKYKVTSPDVYARYAEEYDNVLALYSHAVSRYKLGIGDGAQDSIEEILDLINDQSGHVYRSTPITPFSIDENDFGANALITKLKSEVGTFDEDGNLQTIAKAFADEVFEVEATDFKAEASKLSTLLAQFGTYDPNTNTFSFLATADYFEQVKTYADDNSASAVALDILLAQFGTYDAETETFTFSSTADYFNEVKNYADNDKASAQKLTTLTSQFGSYDPNTNTFTFDNTADYFEQVKTYADENSAAASKISSIGSAFGSFDGNTFNFSEAKITQELNTYTGLDFSNSTYFIDIEAEIESKPIVFRQASEPATTYATGSIWYDTDDENKVYILVDGTPKVWTLTDDSRIGATATHLTTLTAAFGSYDPATGLTIDTTADYFAEVKSYADTESASATKIENLGAELVTFDSSGNVTGVVLSSSFKSAIDTFVSDEANSALASKVEGLRVDIEGSDGTGGITAQVTSNQQVIAARPKIFRQDDAPATTEPVSSLWFDTNDNNKAYVLLGDGGDPEVFTWTETRDQGLISDISNKPFIFRQDDAPATTNPEGSIWYDTNDGNKLYILISEVWTATQDADIATAQATADARPKVFRQDDAPATTEPEFSIWYDTNDNNLSYVLLGDGGDPETFTWTETIDGRVTDLLDFAESKYSLTADANGVVTGLELYSASGPNTTVSTFKITADKFIVRESSTDFVPFALDGTQLKLDVPLNGVSGSFSGSLTAATGTFSGNVDGNIDGTAAGTVKAGAADGATAKGVTDDLSSVVTITSTDIAIVNTDETKAFYDAGTPFYVDNAGDFSLGDKLKYDNSENLLTISGAVTIESVSGLDKADVGLGNVDNTSVANILDGSSGAFDGNVTGTVDGTAASTVKTNAADGASAKAETDKLTSVVTLTNSDIAIINEGETKTYNDAGTPFYVDNTGQFSLGNKLSFNGSNLSVSGTITMSASSTIDGTAASTVKSGAADGANAKDTTDNLESVITITSTKIYQGTGTFGNANTGFYLDDAGQFSLKDKLSFDGTTLSVDGEVTATSGSIGGVSLASNKLYVGTGTYNNANTAFYLDDAGQFSLKDKLSWDGSTLSINGQITSTSGSIGGWEINSSELKSPAVSSVNRLKFSPTAGFIVNDDDNNTALLVNYGALSSLSSTTTGVTFADVSNAEVATWDETVSAGNTLIKIPASNERYIYSSNYLTASFVNDPHGGAYAYEISVDAITGAVVTLTGTSTYLKATLALHVEIATDTNFSNVIKDTELWRSDVTGATTITFPGVSNKAVSFSISDSVTDVYLRFYWYRLYAVAYNDSITWSPKTFNVSSADSNDDLVFLTYKGTTELTNEGVQIINDPTTYFKVDRSNFTSGNPYVDIGGDVKVDGNFTVTGNINLEGDVENSDVTVSNLVERLGEINTAFTLGSSASADVTFAGDVQVDGTLKGPATFTIDPSAYGDATGTVVILGNLQVDGTTTTINSTNVTVNDKILTLSSGAADSTAANDSGIEIDGASAYFKYFHSGTKWVSNKNIEAGTFIGALSGNASTASTAAQLTTARTISLTGTITGSASFDGTADVSIATTTSFDLDDVTDNGATTTNDITIQYNGLGLQVENSLTQGADTGIRIRGARNGQTYASDILTSYILFSNHDNNTTPNNYDLAKIGAGMYDAADDTGYFQIQVNDGTSLVKALDIKKDKNAVFYGDISSGRGTFTHDTFGEGIVSHRNHSGNAASITFRNNTGQAGILYATYADTTLRWRDGVTSNGYEIWHEGNDGSGSGLDADTVDGIQGSQIFKKGADIGGSQNLNNYTTDGYYHQNSNANATSGSNYPVAGQAGMLEVLSDGVMVYQRYTVYNNGDLYVRSYYNGTWYSWGKQWDSGNDGSGSGLDADDLDGFTWMDSGKSVRGDYVYVGSGGGYFYNDASSRVRINQDFYTNNSNTYLYANNLYLGNSSGDNVQVRGNRMYGNNWEIDTDGSAGFGTTSASAQVHIVDNSFPQLRVNDDTGGGEAGMRLRSHNGTLGLHCDIFSKAGSSNETGYLGFRVPWNGYQKLRLHSNGSLSLGIPGNGQNNGGRYLSFEGNADASGEGSGRLFFTEHNSTTASMDNYGMSIGYRGGGTTVTTAGGNSWTGLSQIGNGQWGMWGHDNSLAGALIMYGDRAATYVDFAGNNIQGINDIYVADQIIHTGDTDTYLQFHTTDQFRVVIAGAEVTEWGADYMKMRDNDTIRLGEGSDFRMWHSGSDHYFRNYHHASGNIYWQGEDTEGSNHALLYMINDLSEPYLRLFQNGVERLRTINGGVTVYGRIELDNSNTKLLKGSGNALNITTNSGNVEIGPMNTSYCHLQTDRGAFYFNKQITVNSGVVQSYDEDLQLRRAGTADRIIIASTSIRFFLDSAEDMRLENDGDLHVEGDVIAYSSTISDKRLKDNVETIPNALDKVKALRGVEYTWNKGHREGQRDLGLIAQEVEEVLPEIVREKKMPLMDDTEEKYKTVDYEKVVGVLVEAIKEQQKQIDELKSLINK